MVKKVKLKKDVVKTAKVEVNSNQNKKKLIPIVVGAVILFALVVLLFLQLFHGTVVVVGDTVKLDYTGSLDNGTVFDTSIESVGVQAGLQKQTYQALTFTLGTNQVIPGFEKNVLGMKLNEKKTFTLTPEEGYGAIKPDVNLSGKRLLNITRYETIETNSQAYQTLFNQTPIVGAVISAQGISWQLKVVDLNSTSVKLENILEAGQSVILPGEPWTSTVVEVKDQFITLKRNPKVGDITPVPTQAGVLTGKIISVDATQFKVEVNPNSPLAGKNLTFEVQVKEITKAVKA